MGNINILSVEPRGNKTADEYMNYLANVIAMNQDEYVNLLEGRLSSINIREIAGFLVDLLTLKHKSGLVGMSAADPNNPDAVRLWSGSADMNTAPWRVLQKGSFYATDAFITGLITGSKIIGSEIKTSETAFPRMEFSSLETFFKAFGSATKSIEISVSTAGTPGLFFKDDLGTALLDISSGDFDLLSTLAMSISAPNVSAGGDWTFEKIINASISGNAARATYADNAGRAAAADELAPSGTVAWGQVDKAGSSISHIQTRNLADLTQTATFRTVTDGEKSSWNAKAPLDSPDFTGTPKVGGSPIWHTGIAPSLNGPNGYQKLPNGKILQWVTLNVPAQSFAANTYYSFPVTWPIPFPNAVENAQLTLTGGLISGGFTSCSGESFTKTGCNAVIVYGAASTTAPQFQIFAIGN